MSWHKLRAMNDWGSAHILIGEPHMNVRGSGWSIRDETTPTLKAGTYKVRFPDGYETSLVVRTHTFSESMDDMGHTYNYQTTKPYFVLSHHGAAFEVFAPSLKVEVWRDDEPEG